MPKIRGLKPDFWTDEDIVELSIAARLMFIGLWTYACDNGHLQDKPKQVKMRLFPGDDVSAADLLRELEAASRITRDNGWIIIPNFTKHQRPDRRYFQVCDAPGCVKPGDSQPETRGGHHETTTSTRRAPAVVSTGTPGDGDGDGDGELMVKGARRKRATKLPDDWKPTEKHWERRHDGIDVQREADKFRLHAEANDRRQVSWNAAFSQWLLNARPTPGIQQSLEITDPSQLPPVQGSWMRRRPS